MPKLSSIGFAILKRVIDLADVHKDKATVSILGLFTCFEYGYAGKAYAKPNYRATREYLHLLYRMWVHDDYKEPTDADYAKAEAVLGTVKDTLLDKVTTSEEEKAEKKKAKKEEPKEESKTDKVKDEIKGLVEKAYKDKTILEKLKKIVSDGDKPKKKRKTHKKKSDK